MFSRKKCSTLHGDTRDAGHLADFSDRFRAIVDQVDDFAMSLRQLIDAGVQDTIRFLAIKRCFRRVAVIGNCGYIVSINLLVRSLSKGADSLEAGNLKQPCGNSRPAFEPVCRAPNIKENQTDE